MASFVAALAASVTVTGLLAFVSALPPTLAVNVAVPVVLPFTVAVYVPLPLSVTALSVSVGPVVFTIVTVPPLAVRLFPCASFSCTVRVDVVLPSAVMLVGLAVIVLFASEAAPGVSVTVTGLLPFVMALPPTLAVNVAVPVTDPFTVAVYVPLPLSVTALSVSAGPVVFTIVTVPPLAVRLFPLASFS